MKFWAEIEHYRNDKYFMSVLKSTEVESLNHPDLNDIVSRTCLQAVHLLKSDWHGGGIKQSVKLI